MTNLKISESSSLGLNYRHSQCNQTTKCHVNEDHFSMWAFHLIQNYIALQTRKSENSQSRQSMIFKGLKRESLDVSFSIWTTQLKSLKTTAASRKMKSTTKSCTRLDRKKLTLRKNLENQKTCLRVANQT